MNRLVPKLSSAAILLIGLGTARPAGAGVRSDVISFPKDTSVEVLTSTAGDFVGIGAVTVEGITLAASDRPMRLEIVGRSDKYDAWHKPQPVAYGKRTLAGIDRQGDAATVNVDLEHPDGSTDRLQIVFEFVEESFYESPAVGIRYHFRWSSQERYAHQVRETSWWRFGQSVDGLRFISQNSGYGRNSVDFTVKRSMPFGGYKLAGVVETGDIGRIITAQSENPIAFAYLPQKEARETRQGDGDYLTFYSRESEGLSFLRYADRPTMNYWQFQRVAGEKEVRFEEWYCTALGKRIETAPIVMQVLHKAGINAWIDAKEIVRAKLLKAAGLPDQDPWPWVALTMHAIDDPNERKKQIPFDRALDVMKRAGIKEYWWYGPWKSNWSEVDRMTPEQIEKHGPIYGHAVWDYDWARNKFDVDGFKNLAINSRKVGIHPVIWVTQTMSQCSPFVYAHPDWALRRPDGSLFNYAYKDLVGMNHHSGYSDFLVNRITLRRNEIPFDALWLDSFFFSADIIDWMDPDLAPNFLYALQTMKKLRGAGIRRIYVEHHGPFALSSATGYMDKKKKFAGKQLYLLYNTAPCDHLGNRKLEMSGEVYFKNLAFKSCPQPYLRYYIRNPHFMEKASYANKAYVKALPYMKKCVVLDNDQGTLYWNPPRTKGVVFSFVDGSIDIGRRIKAAREILHERPARFQGSRLSTQSYRVYLVDVQ